MKKIGTLWRQGLAYPYQSSNLLSLLLLVVMLIAGGNVSWAQTETIQAGSSAAGADFSYSDLTVYSYDDNYWAKKNNSTVISLISGSDFTFTNVNGVTITGITVKGVADNNAAKTSTVTITDDASTPNSINTGSVSWSGRQVTTPTSQALTGVNSLKMTAGTKYTVSNSGSNLGIQIEITYTQETQKESFGNLRLTGDACNRTATILSARSTNEYLRFTFADAQGKALSPTDIGVDDFDCILSGDDVIEIEKKTIDTNGRLAVYINPKSATGTATLTVRFKGNSQYNPIDAAPITITVSSPVSITFTANTGGTVAAKGYSGEVDLVSGNTYPSQSVTFTATPAAGYLFDNWHDGSAYVGGGANPYVTTVNSDLTLTANFIESRTINVALATSCAGMGTVALYERDKTTPNLSGTAIKKNLNLDIVATANTNYEFLGWRTTADGTGDFVSTDAKFQKKAEDIANNTTYYAYFQEIDHTVVGKTDNTTPYNGAHSLVYPLAAGKTRHISFVNHNSGTGKNWYNWILNVASTSELATTNPDIMMLRADNYDIKQRSTFASAFNWETFVTDMNGATVVMDVTNSGKHIYVNSTITTTGGKTYKYSAICNDRTDAGTDAHLCFTVEYSHITNLSVGDEAQAYELTYAIKLNGTDSFSDTYGTVTIKNNQGLALRKGTYAPFNEVITYKAEAKSGYRWYKWDSGYTDAERNITVTAAVNPCAVFVQDITFAITTQPASKSYNYNATATALTVVANSAFTMTYQWYSNSADNTTSGTIIEGATNASYTPSTAQVGTTYYYCVVTEGDTGNTLTSSTAKIDVSVPKPSVSLHENIVTISSSVAGAKYYYTLDKSDPATSPTRIEYQPNTVAIHEGTTKIRAVTYIDGHYSQVQGVDIKQGTSVQYEHVVVLEARGAAIPASGTFTDGVSETSKEFKYHPDQSFDFSGGPFISPNSDEPNGERDDVYMTNANDTPTGTYTIGINSSSATKIVIGAGSNSTSSTRSLTSIYVDGVSVSYSASGTSGTSKSIGRIVITGLDIPQGSDVTFNFNGLTSIYYYEIFGESNPNMCKKPDIVPTTHDDTNNIWNYTIKNLEPESTLHYVIVDLNAAEDARIKGSGESTSDINLTYSDGLRDGYMIRAWSTKDGWAQSSRSLSYVESILSPVLKYNVKEAHYNKDGVAGYTTDEPILSVYPSAQLANVTFTTDDNTVGYGTDGQSGITIGSGQGLTTIKANLTVAEGNPGGLKTGTYSTSLKLVVSDGIAYALSEAEKGSKPKIRTNIEIRDPKTDELLLTMMYGGYKYKNGQFNGETKDDKDVFDSWGSVDKFSGYGDGLADSKKYVDGYGYNSQATQDARSEEMALDMAKGGHKAWYEVGTAKVGGGTYAKYERIKPFSLPVRGAYFTFEPQENGVLTLYVLQNGSLNTSKKKVDGVDKDFVTGLSATPRTYYWFDQDGYRIEPTSVTVKQPLTFGTDATDINGSSDWQSQIGVWKALPEYTNHESFESELNSWGDQAAVNTNLEKSEPDPQPIMHYQNGYSILQKAYVKYVVNVVAGKTYYFFSNNSKLGFAGVNFKKSTVPNVTESSSNLTLTRTDDVASKVKPTQRTIYKTATLDRTFKKDTWNTITLPFALSEKQIEKVFGYGTKVVLFNGTTGTDDCLKVYFIEHVDQNILAGQPYFIQPTGVDINGNDLPSVSGDVIGAKEGNTITFNNVCVDTYVALQSYGNNTHPGNDRFDFEFVGTFSQEQVNKYDYYMNATTGDLTQYVGNGTTMNTYRAYLKYHDDPSTPQRLAKVIASVNFNTIFEDIDDEQVTGIMNVLVNEMDIELKPQDGVFNLNGQKVAESTSGLPRGIYIVNGKKIFIK